MRLGTWCGSLDTLLNGPRMVEVELCESSKIDHVGGECRIVITLVTAGSVHAVRRSEWVTFQSWNQG